MTVISAVVLFWVIWFLALQCIIPIGLRTQGETGEVVEGTPSSAPVNPMIWRKAVQTTVVTVVVWGATCAFILWSGVTVRDIDFFHRMGPVHEETVTR
jgi:predicted secreted protein